MQKKAPARKRKKHGNLRRILCVVASILVPPLGIFLVWRTRWSNQARYCLTGLAVACLVLMVALLPSPDARVNGGIELVGRKPEAEIYGPDLPTAMVTGYIAPVSESIFVEEVEDTTTYVYAITEGDCYHLKSCKFTYASSQKLTVYEAHFLGYSPCKKCKPPVYQGGM